MITDSDITAALEVVDAASKDEKQWAIWTGVDDPVAKFAENYKNGPPGDVHLVAMRRDAETPIEVHAITMAITGNGPTSEANAKYIISSFDSVAGWGAALREVRRLSEVNARLLGLKLRKA